MTHDTTDPYPLTTWYAEACQDVMAYDEISNRDEVHERALAAMIAHSTATLTEVSMTEQNLTTGDLPANVPDRLAYLTARETAEKQFSDERLDIMAYAWQTGRAEGLTECLADAYAAGDSDRVARLLSQLMGTLKARRRLTQLHTK